ncbi:hypothetical protein ACLOJK_031624 [Asimina triloba]
MGLAKGHLLFGATPIDNPIFKSRHIERSKKSKQMIEEKKSSILDSYRRRTSIGEIARYIVVDPALGKFLGRVEGLEHGIGYTYHDVDFGAGEGLQDLRVGVEELYFGNAVGLEEGDDLGRRKRVGRRRAPVHANAPGHPRCNRQEEGEKEEEPRRFRHFAGFFFSFNASNFPGMAIRPGIGNWGLRAGGRAGGRWKGGDWFYGKGKKKVCRSGGGGKKKKLEFEKIRKSFESCVIR